VLEVGLPSFAVAYLLCAPCLDVVLYTGPERRINFNEVQSAVKAQNLDIRAIRTDNCHTLTGKDD
jgi:hypothetical protein